MSNTDVQKYHLHRDLSTDKLMVNGQIAFFDTVVPEPTSNMNEWFLSSGLSNLHFSSGRSHSECLYISLYTYICALSPDQIGESRTVWEVQPENVQ